MQHIEFNIFICSNSISRKSSENSKKNRKMWIRDWNSSKNMRFYQLENWEVDNERFFWVNFENGNIQIYLLAIIVIRFLVHSDNKGHMLKRYLISYELVRFLKFRAAIYLDYLINDQFDKNWNKAKKQQQQINVAQTMWLDYPFN